MYLLVLLPVLCTSCTSCKNSKLLLQELAEAGILQQENDSLRKVVEVQSIYIAELEDYKKNSLPYTSEERMYDRILCVEDYENLVDKLYDEVKDRDETIKEQQGTILKLLQTVKYLDYMYVPENAERPWLK